MAQTSYPSYRTLAIVGALVNTEGGNVIRTMRNDEASAEMEFGYAVKMNSTSDPQSAAKLTAITGEIVAGIVLHSNAYSDTQLGDDGVKAGESINVLVRGTVWVLCEDGCDVGERLHIRAVAAGAEIAGAALSDADGSDTIDSQGQGVFLTSAAAGGLAQLQVDFLNPLT